MVVHYIVVIVTLVLLSGCAMKGDVRRIEAELQQYHEQVSMSDSARAATLAQTPWLEIDDGKQQPQE